MATTAVLVGNARQGNRVATLVSSVAFSWAHAAKAKDSILTAGVQVWEDGQALKDLQARLQGIAEQRENIEAARKVGCAAGQPLADCLI